MRLTAGAGLKGSWTTDHSHNRRHGTCPWPWCVWLGGPRTVAICGCPGCVGMVESGGIVLVEKTAWGHRGGVGGSYGGEEEKGTGDEARCKSLSSCPVRPLTADASTIRVWPLQLPEAGHLDTNFTSATLRHK